MKQIFMNACSHEVGWTKTQSTIAMDDDEKDGNGNDVGISPCWIG
jgi:hypothetical protein